MVRAIAVEEESIQELSIAMVADERFGRVPCSEPRSRAMISGSRSIGRLMLFVTLHTHSANSYR